MHGHELIDMAAAAVLVLGGLFFVPASLWNFHRAGSAVAVGPAHRLDGERAGPDVQRISVLLAAALSFGAAAIHLAAVSPHLEEFAPYGYAFAVLAIVQLALGVGLLLGWRYAAALSVALSAAVIVVWIVSRTLGLPFGPDAWQPEEVGAADLISSAFEALIIVLLLAAPGWRRASATALARARDYAYLVLVPMSGIILVVTLIAVAALNGDSHTHLHD